MPVLVPDKSNDQVRGSAGRSSQLARPRSSSESHSTRPRSPALVPGGGTGDVHKSHVSCRYHELSLV